MTGGAATWILAGLALVRAIRGKALYVAIATMVLPVIVVAVRTGLEHDPLEVWEAAVVLTLVTLPVVPTILVGPSLADEIEDKTSAYLWSRPLPRWSIVAGKLAGLAPVAALVMAAGLTVSWLVAGGPGVIPAEVAVRGVVAIAAAAVVAAIMVAALATLMPRHAVATSVAYLLADAGIGALPIKVQYASIWFAGRSLAGVTDAGVAGGAITMLVIGGLGMAIALWRITTLE